MPRQRRPIRSPRQPRQPCPLRLTRPPPVPAAALLLITLLTIPACDNDPPPPSEQAVQQAWQRADDAVRQAEHQQRLREIDRRQFTAAVDELQTQQTATRGVALAIALLTSAALLWLAIEVRRRPAWPLHRLSASPHGRVSESSTRCGATARLQLPKTAARIGR
jgi:hypothetical protein